MNELISRSEHAVECRHRLLQHSSISHAVVLDICHRRQTVERTCGCNAEVVQVRDGPAYLAFLDDLTPADKDSHREHRNDDDYDYELYQRKATPPVFFLSPALAPLSLSLSLYMNDL